MAIATRAGAGLEAGERVLVPLTRTVLLRAPGIGAALRWHRPWGVLVKAGSSSRFVRVPDLSRRIQLGILGAGLVAAFLVRARDRRRRRPTARR
jgi:hypothetical protein